jgi:hypothetical protein
MSLKLLKSLAPIHYSDISSGRAGARGDISFMKGKAMRNDIPLPDCARHLARLWPTVEPEKRVYVSTLRQQCKNYQVNPEALRPKMLATIERLAAPINAEER